MVGPPKPAPDPDSPTPGSRQRTPAAAARAARTTRLLFDEAELESASSTPRDLPQASSTPSTLASTSDRSAGNLSASFSNLVIRASAGTGKTFQLSNRYLALLMAGVPADRILATTFTRKAAGEILERIIGRLATAVRSREELDRLAGFVGVSDLTRERCLGLLQNLLRNLHRLRVGTLDSLFGQLARSFSLEIGLPAGWEIVDEGEEASLRQEAIGMVFQQESTAALCRLANLLTKGETSRGVAQLVRATVTQLHGLFLESSASAWHALAKHRSLKPEELDALLLRLEGFAVLGGRLGTACLADAERARSGDWDSFISTGISPRVLCEEPTYYRKPVPEEIVEVYCQLLEQAKAVLINQVALQTEGSYELLHKFDTARRSLQQEFGGLRFDDVTRQLDRALAAEGTPQQNTFSTQSLAFRMDGDVSHVLLDEFQDTSPSQWRVLRPFVERASRRDGQSSFFCVGDGKQAIYSWRGGEAQIFDAIDRTVPHVVPRQLVTSFRSSQAVIDTVNRVFSRMHEHPHLERAGDALLAWQRQFETHSTARQNLAGYACLRTVKFAADAREQDQLLVDAAAELVQDLVGRASNQTIGVLVRGNQPIGRLIHAMRKRGVDASEEGGNPLTDAAAVEVLLSLLRIGDHPGDRVARFHVANSPLGRALGVEDHRSSDEADRVSTMVRRQLLDRGYGAMVQEWAETLRSHVGERERSRLDQLVELAYLYDPQATLRTDDFVEFVMNERVSAPSRSNVRVMTIHQAKGLEFDAVVLPELDFTLTNQAPPFVIERPEPSAPITKVCRYVNAHTRPLLPVPIQQMFERHTESDVTESLCVLYVALTRAAKSLYMLIAPSKGNERNLPRDMSGLLRVALHDGQPCPPETVLFEHGDPDWMRGESAEPVVEAPSGPTGDEPANPRIRLAKRKQRRRSLPRISPSKLEGSGTVTLARSKEFLTGAAAARGSLFHAWFEAVEWLDSEPPTDDQLRRIAQPLLRSSAERTSLTPWLAEFHRMLEQPQLLKLLSRARYQPGAGRQLAVQVELPFAVAEAGGILTGNIDRLVIVSDGSRPIEAEVIDFKTDRVHPSDPQPWQARIEHYRPQLEAYRRAIVQQTGLPLAKIRLQLAFVEAGEVVAVS